MVTGHHRRQTGLKSGGRGSGFGNWEVVDPKSSIDGFT